MNKQKTPTDKEGERDSFPTPRPKHSQEKVFVFALTAKKFMNEKLMPRSSDRFYLIMLMKSLIMCVRNICKNH